MKNIALAIKLIFLFSLLTTLVFFFIRLGIAFIFLIKESYFYFEWMFNITDSLKRGTAVGTVLGMGIWLLNHFDTGKIKR